MTATVTATTGATTTVATAAADALPVVLGVSEVVHGRTKTTALELLSAIASVDQNLHQNHGDAGTKSKPCSCPPSLASG